MRIEKDKIVAAVEDWIESEEMFLVDVVSKSGNRFAVYIDSKSGVSIDECVNLSRHLNAKFDRESQDYELIVSSPGLDMPLKVKAQFEKYMNKSVSVLLEDGGKMKGILKNYSDTELELEIKRKVRVENKKKKELIIEVKKIEQKEIKAVKPVVSFK